MPTRMHWVCSQPTPYNNLLFSWLTEEGFDLTVHFERIKRHSHPWQQTVNRDFRWRTCSVAWSLDWSLLRSAMLDRESVFVVGGWFGLGMILVLLIRIAFRLPFLIWTDTPDPRPRSVLRTHIRQLWLRVLFRESQGILVTGQAGASLLREMGCPKEKIAVFPYWVAIPSLPTKAGHSQSKADGKQPVRFIAIGRLEPIKRFDLAIHALEQLVLERGTDAVQLVLIGDGSEQERLERQVQTAHLDSCVKFAGWKEHEEAMRLLEESDVLLHLADWEPYGVVVLEAMARGKPVIASTKTMAAVDRIEHGVSGFIVNTGDSAEIARCARIFIEERSRIADMGCQARRVAEQWPVKRSAQILRQAIILNSRGNGT